MMSIRENITSNKEMEETFRKMNQEAAAEIAVQLRLRNLSGIILIDFINMKDQNHKKELLENLQAYLNRDPVKGTVVDMTSLNIVEVTRKKVRTPCRRKCGNDKGGVPLREKSQLTTLCYIETSEKYLMLHRVSKKNDVNKDKWIGVGGHFEENESPEDCLLREVWRETGLSLSPTASEGL